MEWTDRFERLRPLKNSTTFGIGGPADYFIEIRDIASMQSLLAFCHHSQLPFFILGKGSNTLFDDRGFAGVVIANRIHFLNKLEEDSQESKWHAGSGYSFSLLGAQTARLGWEGLEFASGIPGSIGGAVYMNAGANGSQTCDPLISVDFVKEDGRLITLSKEELSFSYRNSSFQKMRGAIAGAAFKLVKSQDARSKQLGIIHHRKKTQPLNDKSAGCIFRNPSCGHAGALIEQSGLKGKSIGGAQVSSLHANFVVNTGGATSADVLELIAHIRHEVKMRTGIDLEPEVRFIPYDTQQKDK